MATEQWHHRQLDVWRRAMDLTEQIYALTRQLPATERFGLTAQMRSSAVSVPSNIAEGAARGTSAEFARFLLIARGSIAELETQLELVRRLKLATNEEVALDGARAVRQMLTGLIRKVRSNH